MGNMTNSQLVAKASQLFPGGVNSPVRAMGSVGLEPMFVDRAQGPYIYDTSGKQLIDFIASWGAMILGHAHPKVVEQVSKQAAKGFSYGISCPLEVELGQKVQTFFPHLECMRFVNSGTEATMSTIRLARAATGRDDILKFVGCYHGHADALLVQAGSGLLTHSSPSSSGVDPDVAKKTLLADYNDIDSVKAHFNQSGEKIAAIIVEPIAGNMNMVLPEKNFLETLREICDRWGSLLIFDEVMTGFRVHSGGAQAIYGVKPDLTALGKVIGGGLPAACYGGDRKWMEHVSPLGKMYQAGTLSGNPIAMAAGCATLNEVKHIDYQLLENNIEQFLDSWKSMANENDLPFSYCVKGGMFGFAHLETYPTNFNEVKNTSSELFKAFYQSALEQGLYFAPSLYEAGFVSIQHSEAIFAQALDKIKIAYAKMNQMQSA